MKASLVVSKNYTSRIIRAIERANKSIFVLALIIERDKDASAIIDALVHAAARGVNVSVMIDFSTYSFKDGHLNPYYGYRDPVTSSRHLTNRLRAHGATVQWLGQHNPFLFAGRTHSKWIVADDHVFCFGGINLHADFTSDNDFMIEMNDPNIARVISTEHKAIADADNQESAYLSKAISVPQGEILIDGGIPFDSIIYRRATDITKDASEVLVVTQYCPTGRLAKNISVKSHRVYYNAPTTKDALTNGLIGISERMTGLSNQYRGKNYLHAKFIIATYPNGQKTAITGSHNFISYGGLLGTREIALMTSNESLISLLESFYRQHIALET